MMGTDSWSASISGQLTLTEKNRSVSAGASTCPAASASNPNAAPVRAAVVAVVRQVMADPAAVAVADVLPVLVAEAAVVADLWV